MRLARQGKLCTRISANTRPRQATRANAAAPFIPAQVSEIVEPAAQAMAKAMKRVPITIPTMPGQPALETAFVGPTASELASYPPDVPAVVLLHGFDSSCMEFRRLYPKLAASAPTYALDLVRVAVQRQA